MLLHADDGLTITDQGLVISSTTIALANSSLTDQIKDQGYPHWLRELIASQISHQATEWFENYKPFSSGACGVEWTVLDLKRFAYGEDLLDNTVLLVDDIPGMIVSEDVTSVVKEQKYIGSFDVPWNLEVFQMAGYQSLSESNPELYSYYDSSRSKILRERAPNVSTRKSVWELIGYNNVSDPNQNGRADLGISAREELVENGKCRGAIDRTWTSVTRALHLGWDGAVGPSFENQPGFGFNKTDVCKNVVHQDVPNDMAFFWKNQHYEVDVNL
jgi:hypothetical protein